MKKNSMNLRAPFLYNIEFAVDKIDIYDIPSTENIDEVDICIQFKMNPDISLEISEDEMIMALNCGGKKIKNKMFSLSERELKHEREARIVAKLLKNSGELTVGTYEMRDLNKVFKKLRDQFEDQQKENENRTVKITTPFDEAIKELAPFRNVYKKPVGSVLYILRITCFGPRVDREEFENEDFEGFMTSSKSNINSDQCQSKDKSEYDEYMAQINGNSLIVRVNKENPYLVTRVYEDSCSKDQLTIRGCDQQIDFKFPTNFTCCQCKKKYGNCKCNAQSDLTEHQRKTSCAGSSYKNSTALPAIRGNLKYPGRFDDQSIKFSVNKSCDPKDTTDKYRLQGEPPKSVCMQVDKQNLMREMSGKSNIQKGIKMCKLGCEDDMDVFVLKIGKKKTTRDGKCNQIELEMRTPRAPNIECKKMESREIQVLEEEFPSVNKDGGIDGLDEGKDGKGKISKKGRCRP